jgi:hypothetical protein
MCTHPKSAATEMMHTWYMWIRNTITLRDIADFIIIYLNCKWVLYPVAVYYNETQHTNNTPHSNKHSTQNYTNNKGHTTHNECNANTIK